MAAGLLMMAFGNAWAPAALDLLAGSTVGAWLELVLPLLPLGLIALGVSLLVRVAKGD